MSSFDPTDNTDPQDTDFAKGAARELRTLKQYLQNSNLWMRAKFGFSAAAPTIKAHSGSTAGAVVPSIVRTGVGTYNFVWTGVNFPADADGGTPGIPDVAFDVYLDSGSGVNQIFVNSATLSQDTTAHTVTLSITIKNWSVVSGNLTGAPFDPVGSQTICVYVYGAPNFPALVS